MFQNNRSGKSTLRNKCFYTVADGTTTDAEGNVVWAGSGSSGSSFNANSFDWGGTIQGAATGLGNLFGGIGTLVASTNNNNNNQPMPNGSNGGYSTNGNNTGATNTSQPVSTTVMVLGAVLVVLIIVAMFLLFKSQKSA